MLIIGVILADTTSSQVMFRKSADKNKTNLNKTNISGLTRRNMKKGK